MVSDRAANISGSTTPVNDALVESDANSLAHDKLHIEVQGDPSAPPVVLLHGWGSSARLMGPAANALATDFFVHNIDLPGHGLSPAPPSPCGLPEQAELVRSYISDTFSQPVVLFGHSNGGRISLYLASRPDVAPLISKLVLVSPSGIRPSRGLGYYVKSSIARTLKFPARFLRGKLKDAVLDWLTHSLVWKLLGSSDYNALTGTMRESFVATVNYFVEDVIAEIKAPTLLFWGDKDTAVSLKQMKTIESLIPDCGLVVLKGAGHYGYLDQPHVVFSATRFFLAPEKYPIVTAGSEVATDAAELTATDVNDTANEYDDVATDSADATTTKADAAATEKDGQGPATEPDIKTEKATKGTRSRKNTRLKDKSDQTATKPEVKSDQTATTPEEKSDQTATTPKDKSDQTATTPKVTPDPSAANTSRGTKAPRSKRRRKKADRSKTGRQKNSNK